MSKRVLKIGMVGGGKGAFIAQPHQKAIFSDGTRRVVAGALFPDPKIAMEEAANWPYPIKGYESYDAMIADQKNLPEDERLDYVLIVTPNWVHFDPAIKAIEAGIPVMCEKPLCISMEQADKIVEAVERKKVPFAVAHTYLGHWTTRFTRFIVQSGLLGEVQWVDASYIQGWLGPLMLGGASSMPMWRTNPQMAGKSGCGGDIATHALMHLRFTTGLDVTDVSAHLEKFIPGNALDDHFTAYCKLSNGGKAMVRASQISHGHKNDLGIEIVGTKASLEWKQENSECVTIHVPGQPDRVYWRREVQPNDGFLGDVPADLLAEPQIPSGHCEGFHDAYARLHRFFEADVRAYWEGKPFNCDGSKYANVYDGRMGMAFIDASVASSEKDGAWVKVDIKK
ncbi:Gfo/Idh/MocA family protein [Intestinicryptomonas porci]|uniref:Gfo/Idh/MocA family oxidoreductase n=1 Tax=Intestinicryptomonas porci TaxID=2926320 RepID=A0ABU4WGI5_9BACT|nr:Gfo/Idh/MocA family oxidoreductase [Opitutales bacterium CLA-KB-P66]